jgi:peptidoglycan/xylan/chitin deacetylase (PgdA/CDA1 family)
MAESGLVEIGSHSSHHLKLKTLSEVKARSEIADSKADLEKLLGVSVNTFAYPFGLYGEGHPKLVQEAGYASAASMIWTVARNTADPFQLPRLNIGERSGKELVAFLKGFK